MFDPLYDKLDRAISAAEEKHGRRPWELIAWRNYSAIGGGEIDGAREGFLSEGCEPATIEKEYRDAKKRQRAAVRAGKDWDKRVGVNALAKAVDTARDETRAARKALAHVPVLSIADASALIEVVHLGVKQFKEITDWEAAALSNANKFLNRLVAA